MFFYCFKVLLWKSSDDLSCFGEFPLQCSILVQYKLHYLVFRNHSAPLASLVVAFPFVNDDINIYIYWQWPLCGSVKYNTTIIPSYNTPKPLPSLCFLLIITPVTCPAESLNTHPGLFVCLFVLPSTFSRSLMCCRLHPVSSLLRSDSWWYDSSLEWAFLRSLGLADTQQEVVLPIFIPPNTHTHN